LGLTGVIIPFGRIRKDWGWRPRIFIKLGPQPLILGGVGPRVWNRGLGDPLKRKGDSLLGPEKLVWWSPNKPHRIWGQKRGLLRIYLKGGRSFGLQFKNPLKGG